MGKLFKAKYVNMYIRRDLSMSVRSDMHDRLDEKIKQILEEAKERANRDNRKTIMAKDI